MKNVLTCLILITAVISYPFNASAEFKLICTRSRGATVNLRKGPGTNYPLGLTQVGSGGMKIVNFFKQRRYQAITGERVMISKKTRGTDGYIWYKVTTNQWVA